MAMPYMENEHSISEKEAHRWFSSLIEKVKAQVPLNKVLFEFQVVNWRTQKPIPEVELIDWMKLLQQNRIYSYGYYPDNFLNNQPNLGNPAGMAIYWVTASLCYYLFMEGKLGQPTFQQMPKERVPMVSIMVPCYNEGDNLDEAIPYLLQLRYPNYELIFINDGSKDNTGEIIERWAKENKRIVALHQENQGKASALNHGLLVAKGEYVACIDGDAVLDFDAIDYMVQSLELNRSYGAVTGNPRVRNRSTILGRLQVSEFSSIIGLIKRAQSLMGTIFTVSGVCCLFRKEIMEEIGGWSTNMITEDIDISWKIQTAGYNIMYEPSINA